MQKNVIFTLRNVLYRGFLDEEEDWKKSGDTERMGRVWGRRWNSKEEKGRGGGGDTERKDVPGVEIRVRETLVYSNWLGSNPCASRTQFWFPPFYPISCNMVNQYFDIHDYMMFYFSSHIQHSLLIWQICEIPPSGRINQFRVCVSEKGSITVASVQ